MRIFLIAVILPLIGLEGAVTLDWLMSRRSGAVWSNGGRRDYLCTLMALDLLERSGIEECLELAKVGRDALANDLGSGLHPTLARCMSKGRYDELAPYVCKGFSNEEGAFPDLLSTLWCCHFLAFREGVNAEWLSASKDFIYEECLGGLSWGLSGEGNVRLAHFVLSTLLALGEPIAAEALEHMECNAAADNMELALQLGMMCVCGEWEKALELRSELLAARNYDGSWSEISGKEGDVLTTCIALEALDAFTLVKAAPGPDLDVPSDGVTLKDGELRLLLFNNGVVAALPCVLEVEFYGENALLSREVYEVARLERRHTLRFAAAIPNDARLAVIRADAAGATGDVDWSNNVCHVKLGENALHAIELSPLLAGGDNGAEPLFLGGGLGVIVTGAMAHHGQCDNDRLSWELLDNGRRIGAGLGCGRIEVEWFPQEGMHCLALNVKCKAEQKTRTTQFEVVHDAAVLKTYSLDAAGAQPCGSFGAREYVTFCALSSYIDCDAEVRVYSPDGSFLGKAEKSPVNDRQWQWHTGDCAPGVYRAEAHFRKGTVRLAKAESAFEILPTFKASELKIEEPTFAERLYQRQKWQSPLTFSWHCIANMQKKASISWEIKGPSGQVCEFGGGETPVLCNTSRLVQCASVPAGLEGCFSEHGTYELCSRLAYGDELMETTLPFCVLRRPVISVGSTVLPEEIDTGPNMLRTTVMLEGDAGGFKGEPASFEVGGNPVMLQGASVAIRLIEVRDAHGNLVDDGAVLCSVPYGRLAGGESLAEAERVRGDFMRFQVKDGIVRMEYRIEDETAFEGRCLVPIYISVRKEGTMETLGSVGVFISRRED